MNFFEHDLRIYIMSSIYALILFNVLFAGLLINFGNLIIDSP